MKLSTEEKVHDAIAAFNKYKGAEANASLLSTTDREFVVCFSGHMCYTCGYHDYFDDLLNELEERGVKAHIKTTTDEDGKAIVTFVLSPP